jgi:hypothetical protein
MSDGKDSVEKIKLPYIEDGTCSADATRLTPRHGGRRRLKAAPFIAAALAGFTSAACDILLPMPEIQYKFLEAGAPPLYFDDFEKNDGKASTRFYYKQGSQTRWEVSSDWASSGRYSIKIPGDGKLVVPIDLAVPGYLSLAVKDIDGSYVGLFFDGEASYSGYTTAWTNPDGGRCFQWTLPAGRYDLGISRDPRWYSPTPIYIDDLTIIALAARSPADQTVLTDETPVELVWSSAPGIAAFRVQLAYDQAFVTAFLDQTVSGQAFFALSALTTGRGYYWRVGADSGDGAIAWTSPRFFACLGGGLDDDFSGGIRGAATKNYYTIQGEVEAADVGIAGSRAAVLSSDYYNSSGSSLSLRTNFPAPKIFRTAVRMEKGALYAVTGTADSFTTVSAEWHYPIGLVPAGESKVFFRINNYYSYYGIARGIVDDLTFFDVPVFVPESFSAGPSASGTADVWGFYRSVPPMIAPNAGRDGGPALSFDANVGDFIGRQARLIADFPEACVLAFDYRSTFWTGPEVKVNSGFVTEEGRFEPIGDTGWYTGYRTISAGINVIDFDFEDGAMDNVRTLPYATNAADDDFESGDLSTNQYLRFAYFDGNSISAEVAHSGAWSVCLESPAGQTRDLVLPVSLAGPTRIEYWIYAADAFGEIDLWDDNRQFDFSAPGNTWVRRTVDLPAGRHLLIWQSSDDWRAGATYLDDLTFTPL